eukprot:2625913-Pyramimonas_sp.AAC.1
MTFAPSQVPRRHGGRCRWVSHAPFLHDERWNLVCALRVALSHGEVCDHPMSDWYRHPRRH